MHIEAPDSAAGQPSELDQLIAAARERLEARHAEEAVALLREGLARHGQSEKFLFEFGYALYEAGELAEAAERLRASIQLAPEARPEKFFTLAQISEDKPAKELFAKGLRLSRAKLAQLPATPASEAKRRALLRPVAQAHCALAQLEAKKLETGRQKQFSEAEFLAQLSEAAAAFPGFLETYLLGAVYYFNCQNEELWRKAIEGMLAQVAALEAAGDEELDQYGCDFFLPLVRLMVECQMWPEAARLVEAGLANDGAHLEANYLLAFCLFSQGRLPQAEDVLERLEELKVRESGDAELIEGFEELRAEVAKGRAAREAGGGGEGAAEEDEWASDDLEDG